MALIEIFKAGEHKSASGKIFNITKDDLQRVVNNYDVSFHEAPAVVGHPQMDAPAYGWVKHLQLDGEILKAEMDVDSEFAELVRDGKFKKISAAFYLPQSDSNPKPEGYYLRHVGFLGAMPPAVKGLKDPIFHDSHEDVVEFGEWENASLWSRLRDFFIEKFGLEETDKVLPAWQVQGLHEAIIREEERALQKREQNLPHFTEDLPTLNPTGEISMTEEEISALKAENAKLKAEKLASEKATRQAENAQFAEQLIGEGKLPPKLKDSALALLNIDPDSAAFSEEGFQTQLKAFLSELPKSVEFGEVATKDKAATPPDESVEYAEGTSAESIEMDKAVRAYMKEHNVGYTAAFNAIHS